MKKNLFVISENERERILSMHMSATKKNYLFEQQGQPLAPQPKDVKGFQSWVINQKGDTTILGPKGADGVYGNNTKAAWAKYGQEYTDAFGGASPQQAIQQTATDRQGWLSFKCVTDVGTEIVTKNGHVLYNLSPGFIVAWDAPNRKPVLFSNAYKGSQPKFERFIDCNDRSLYTINQDRTASDEANWANWACVTSVGKKRTTSKGWVVFDFPNNQYVYFDDNTKKPALADANSKQKIRDMECTDEVLKSATGSTTGTTTASTLVGLARLSPDMQTRVSQWAESPAGKYIIALPADQREAGLDNLDRRRGDKVTRELKKEIRTALGMAADTAFQRLGQGVQGAIAGAQSGYQGKV